MNLGQFVMSQMKGTRAMGVRAIVVLVDEGKKAEKLGKSFAYSIGTSDKAFIY